LNATDDSERQQPQPRPDRPETRQPATDTPENPAETASTPPATIGALLRQAREHAGLSLDKVAERTKVRPGVLRHIEADEHDNLPALTYTLGFVKAYARTVGVDPAAAAERYRQESQKGDPVPTMVEMQPVDEQRRPTRAILWWSTAILLVGVMLLWAWGAGWFTPPPPAEPVTPVQAQAAVPPPPKTEAQEPEAPAGATTPVSLTAKNEVWLRVHDGSNNENFFLGTLQPGQILSLPPGRPWVLQTGRAGALEVKVGTEILPPLGGPAEFIRNVSLKPEDLTGGTTPRRGLEPVQPIAG